LCTDIAIISQGRLVATGSLEELRRGIRVEGDGLDTVGPMSLEDYFIRVVGGVHRSGDDVLEWLG
jgi:ABC-type multidrug transport system ATPase subunit